jgi:hypothetical protein
MELPELPEFGLFTDFSEVIKQLDEAREKIGGMEMSNEMKMRLLKELDVRHGNVMFGKNMMDSILRCLVVIFLLMYTR